MALALALVVTAAAPAAADAGDASAVAVRASLNGTVLGLPIDLVDATLSDVAVSQGDPDAEETETLLEIDLPVIGTIPLVSAAVVSSTASSNSVRAEGSSFLSDVEVNLPLGVLPQVLGLDAVRATATCPIVGVPTAEVEPPVTVTLLGQPVDVVIDQDIEVDIGIAQAVLRIGATEVTTDTALAVGLTLSLDVDILAVATVHLDLTIAEAACERGVGLTEVFAPFDLDVDYQVLGSDGNRVFEAGELVDVAPEWLNQAASLQAAIGDASNLTGPAGPTYTLAFDAADYGIVESGESSSCKETGVCYQMDIGPLGVERPARHWDATFDETLSDESSYTWTLHLGDSFLDVSRTNSFYRFIETIWHHGITLGCDSFNYCPSNPNQRRQMAVFILRSIESASYLPPPCVEGEELFDDVPAGNVYCRWIEELANRGIAAGCGGGNFCPTASITRAQMSVFLLRGLEGQFYSPPPCSGIFVDVACPSTFANWIEDLFNRGITAGCATSPDAYCPSAPVTRGQMTAFLTRTFGLRLYGP